MTRSKVISVLLGLILVACAGVIVADQAGMLGNAPFPGSSGGATTNPYDLPPGTTNSTPSTPPANNTPTTPPTDNSGYGGLK